MTQYIGQISAKTKEGRHALVIVDGAAWHTEDCASPYSNVTLLKLPPYSPELNPVEQIWSWLRQHHLSNRTFKGYEDILDGCSSAWNDFISEPRRVMKMCYRDWIKLT